LATSAIAMSTFEEYQAVATKVPLSLRNNLDRINLPLLGLQQEAGKFGSLLTKASASGKLTLTDGQRGELQDRLGEIFWCIALLCSETGIPMQGVATHSVEQLQGRARGLDPDQR
jgi:hypothetical protein